MPEEAAVSNERHEDAVLPGYEGPFYTDKTDALGAVIDNLYAGNQALYNRLGHSITDFEFEGQWQALTDDGYTWFTLLVFACDGSRILIAIPWAQDRSKADGTQRDRSIAVYVSSRKGEQWIEPVLKRVIAAVRWHTA